MPLYLLLKLFLTPSLALPLVCKAPGDCHPSVGAVHSSLGVCTGSVIGENLILTNAHCIPPALSSPGANCLKKIVISLPKVDTFDFAEFDCDKVVELSKSNPETTELKIDYAILQTKKVLHRPIILRSTAGLENEKKYTIYKMNPRIKYGEMQKIECLALHNTYLNPYFKSEKSPLVLLKECPTEKGNSGAPIIAADGTLRAIFSGALDSHKNSIINIAVGTSLACVDSSLKNSAECTQPINHRQHGALALSISSSLNKKATDELNSRIKARVDSMNESATYQPRVFKFKEFVKDEIDVVQKFAIEPECFLSPEKMKDFLNDKKSILYGFQVHSGLDQNFRMTYKIDSLQIKAHAKRIRENFLELSYSIEPSAKSPVDSSLTRVVQLELCN